MGEGARTFDLEERLIAFAGNIISLTERLPNTRAGAHIAGQLVRSGTSPAPNYGEAQAAESRKDFIHKMKVVLKELRETGVWLKIIHRNGFVKDDEAVSSALEECDELVRIFSKSIVTAEANKNKGKLSN